MPTVYKLLLNQDRLFYLYFVFFSSFIGPLCDRNERGAHDSADGDPTGRCVDRVGYGVAGKIYRTINVQFSNNVATFKLYKGRQNSEEVFCFLLTGQVKVRRNVDVLRFCCTQVGVVKLQGGVVVFFFFL